MKRAFSLVELSVSILIIALIIAGVVSGKTILKQSSLKKLYSEYHGINAGMVAFQNTYGAYPGDYTKAYKMWGSNCGSDGDVNSDDANCNGNGNFQINWDQEAYRAWQHLSLAKLIGGSYTGQKGSGIAPGINSFLSAANLDADYQPMHHGNGSADNHSGSKNVVLPYGPGGNPGPVLTPGEAYSFDLKYDDGKAYKGKIRSRFNGATLCDGSNTNGASIDMESDTYDLTNSNKVCSPLFVLDSLL